MLSPGGVDYAIDINRKRVQHTNNNLAIIFAGLTVFLSVTSLYKTIISQRELNNKQQQLQMQLQSSDSLQRIYQNQMNYILGKMAKDSLETSKK